ncbi:HD domain-containing phosphohydrolase [Dongia sp.]|uniref:HD domain-containing phosphohydrolase n=1 Tax=Dongia sp. TaxID=1977262 RepID=UPI0035AEAAEA
MVNILHILNAGGSLVLFVVCFLAIDLACLHLVKRRHQQLIRNALLILFGPATIYFHIHTGAVGPLGHADMGHIVDERGAAIALASLFGGIPVAVLTAAAEVLARAWVGGSATLAGVSGICLDLAFCSLLVWAMRHRETGVTTFRMLVGAGCAVGAGEALSLLLIGSWEYGAFIFRTEGPTLFLVQLIATLVLGTVLKIQGEMRAARAQVEEERLRSRKSMLEEEAFRAGAITATTDSLMKLDLKGNITEVADSYVRWSGYTRDELIGMPIRKRNATLSDDEIDNALRHIVRDGKLIIETVHRRKDGSTLPVEAVAVYSEMDGGSIYVFLRDISDRKKAEQQLEEKSLALKHALKQTIRALSTAMVHRDQTTAGHEDRVSDLATAIGRELKLDPERLEGLGLAAMVHDVGQIQVPSEILLRPQRLGAEEFALLKMHAEAGADILHGIAFPWPIAEIIHQHHENFDGTGYPRGLKGNAILLEARIVRVADSIEAMLSHRPFRRARTIDYAVAELKAGSGRQFDPVVAEAGIKLLAGGRYQLKPLAKAAE